jgi:hypothetical protein
MKRLSTIIGPDLYRELGRDAEAEQVLRQEIAESPSRDAGQHALGLAPAESAPSGWPNKPTHQAPID